MKNWDSVEVFNKVLPTEREKSEMLATMFGMSFLMVKFITEKCEVMKKTPDVSYACLMIAQNLYALMKDKKEFNCIDLAVENFSIMEVKEKLIYILKQLNKEYENELK